MNTVIFAGGSSLAKAQGVVSTYPGIWEGAVLDVGCRGRELEKALLEHDVQYAGLDLYPPADIIADLGERIPLDDGSVDVVTALDVLEHTDDLHHAFSEICRVASRHVVITLPNAYELAIRLRVLRGRPVSGKYGLPTDSPSDRHRWFFSLDDARAFVHANARRHGWRVADERAIVGGRRVRFASLISRFPNLGTGTYLCRLEPATP